MPANNVTLTGSFTKNAPTTGSIVLTKTVKNATTNTEFVFDITVNGQTESVSLKAGDRSELTYDIGDIVTITERDYADYTTTVNGKATNTITVTVTGDETKTVEFVNTYVKQEEEVPGVIIPDFVVLTYESNGGTPIRRESYLRNFTAYLTKVPTREGYEFTGWYADKELTKRVVELKMNTNKTVYAGWIKIEEPVIEEPVIDDDSAIVDVPDQLNGADHFAYIIGYDDGLVRPENTITRAEVATIFFRLLDEDVRDDNLTRENSFSDVNDGDWFNTAVSTMSALGIINGYPDGTFRPKDPITRAEFAAIAARFDDVSSDYTADFTDMGDHWASVEISKAAENGWVTGYLDGSFKPDKKITRAEAMAIINRVLNRNPESVDDLHEDMVVWLDNLDTEKWYYLDVQEATNSHDYVRKVNGAEYWTEINENPDWTKYED